MSLHPAFFALAALGLAAAVLGIVEQDSTVRDGGIVFAIAAIAVGLALDSPVVKGWRRGSRIREDDPVKVKEESGFEALAPVAAPAPAGGEVVRPPFGKVSQEWDASFTIAPAPTAASAPQPMPVAPRGAAAAPVAAPPPRVVQPTTMAVPAPVSANGAPERLTRGICSKCQSPITVSSRRPIRVTCPMCGHSKILQ